ncbi:hypothetical protein EVG20_g1555 [Dentipellis fragilis]|uniref:Aldehyde dehydrogenase domain-containing protein n=1 Tax=Dentipellis fragilis TaxID=205917 RepID=A0A4Y9Z9J2_9AGAM|nr:hypothetical protein EVG20_g1555 [Dentipellis fragilis]
MSPSSATSSYDCSHAGFGQITVRSHGPQVTFPELSYAYPLKLLSPRLEQPGVAVTYMLTYGGGLVGGDRIALAVDVGDETRLVLLSQGSTKVFKTRPGDRASVHARQCSSENIQNNTRTTVQRLTAQIASGGALFLLPDPVTCFRAASYHQVQTFHLATNASAVLLDWVTSGRRSLGEEWVFSRYHSVNEVFVGGERIARDALLLEDEESSVKPFSKRTLRDRLAPYSCYANLILYGPQIKDIIRDLDTRYQVISLYRSSEPSATLWSMSSIEGNEGRMVRVAGKETEDVKDWLRNGLTGLECIVGPRTFSSAPTMSPPTSQTTIIPHSQKPLVTRTYPTESQLDDVIQSTAKAQKAWARVPLKDRIAIGTKFTEEFQKLSDEVPLELTLQMGRPVSQTPGEIRGFLDRARYMLSIAEASLADVSLQDTDKPGFRRFIRRTPQGVVLVIAPWNFPYLVSINSVLPALIAGNAVLLKPSPQTPLTAELFANALIRAGVPQDVIQVLHLSPELVTRAVQHPLLDFVSFTGSVAGGQAVEKAATEAPGFKGVALELGGKDPAYVRADADLDYTAAEVAPSSILRVYVHESVFDAFVSKVVEIVKKYKLGDPTKPDTTLGPVVSLASAERIRKQIADAVKAGAKPLIPEELFYSDDIGKLVGTTYVAPQVLVDVDHSMDVMKEETFGPVVGIQRVSSDEEAIRLINDSPYGLTVSIWTNAQKNPDSQEAFLKIVDEVQTGTLFLNRSRRCDVLDPALAWTGVKNSGRGVSLSKFGYDQLTRAKSVHMKIQTS